MGREHFPEKRAGDPLGFRHVNNLSAVCRRLGATVSSYGAGFAGSSIQGTSGLVPYTQEIVYVQTSEGDGIYKVRLKYYDTANSQWTNSEQEYTLDAGVLNQTFAVDEVLVAFYHEGRQAFIPLSGSTTLILRAGVAASDIGVGESGTINIWEKPETDQPIANANTQVQDVWHDWITGGRKIEQGDEVFIGWFGNEGVWRIIGAECSGEE